MVTAGQTSAPAPLAEHPDDLLLHESTLSPGVLYVDSHHTCNQVPGHLWLWFMPLPYRDILCESGDNMLGPLKKAIPSGWKKQIKKWVYKFTCPFCGHSANALGPMGFERPVLRERQVIGGGKRAAACPNCGSIDRERLVYAYLNYELQLFAQAGEKRVLHIAPEKLISRELITAGLKEYVCGDLFTEGYEYPAHVRNMDVLDIPFGDDHFDLVICNHVLEHIPSDEKAMQEIRRVLKPGGRAILQVPISANSPHTVEDPSVSDPQERERRFGQHDHIRIYGQDYTDRLARSGFKVKRTNISSRFRKYGVNPKEDLFICRK